MYDEIVEGILESVGSKPMAAETYPKLSGQGYKACKIDLGNFHKIEKKASERRIAFIDGGSSEIIASGNFALSLIRACYVVSQKNKRTSSGKFDIFAFTRANAKANEIHYGTTFFMTGNPIGMEDFSLSSFDPTIMAGLNRAEIGSVANAARRFAELKLAKMVADSRMADIIVLDGNLQSTFTDENKYLSDLHDSCSTNNVILAALSKTTSLFTDNGNLLSVALSSISPLPAWFYHPIAEINSQNHKAEMFFAKFHPKSRHVFRFEIFNKQKTKAEEIINVLASNCTDAIFIGYPYGLVEADRLARVSNTEKESLKAMLLVRLNKPLEKYLSSVNAHEILDRISY